MAIVGLSVAYLWASPIGQLLGTILQQRFGCSKFMGDKIGTFLVGASIYLFFRLIGFFTHRFFATHIEGYKKVNRFGGALLGATKGVMIVMTLFFFIALIPREYIHSWTPKLFDSTTYKLATRYNPMGNQKFLERMRDLRAIVQNGAKKQKLETDPELEKLLKRHDMQDALKDKEFMKSLEEGDFEHLRKVENMEKLMNDGEMQQMIDRLSKEGNG
jgi:hypothetical protein